MGTGLSLQFVHLHTCSCLICVAVCVCVCVTLWLLGQAGPLNEAGGLPHSHGLGGDFVRPPSLRFTPLGLAVCLG